MCYLIIPISKQKALGLQFSTAEFHVPAMGMGCFHPPLPMHVFAEKPGLRAAPPAQGVGTDSKDLGCFGGREPGFLGLSRHEQSVGVCRKPTQSMKLASSLRLPALANQNSPINVLLGDVLNVGSICFSKLTINFGLFVLLLVYPKVCLLGMTHCNCSGLGCD